MRRIKKAIHNALIGLFTLIQISFFSEVTLAQNSNGEDLIAGLSTLCCFVIIAVIIIIILIIILLLKKIFSSSRHQTTVVQQPPPQQQQTQQPPPSSQKPIRNCPDCGQQLRYIEEYDSWYCDNCQEYK